MPVMPGSLSPALLREAQALFDELAAKRLRARLAASRPDGQTVVGGATAGGDVDAPDREPDSATLIDDLRPGQVVGTERLKRGDRVA